MHLALYYKIKNLKPNIEKNRFWLDGKNADQFKKVNSLKGLKPTLTINHADTNIVNTFFLYSCQFIF